MPISKADEHASTGHAPFTVEHYAPYRYHLVALYAICCIQGCAIMFLYYAVLGSGVDLSGSIAGNPGVAIPWRYQRDHEPMESRAGSEGITTVTKAITTAQVTTDGRIGQVVEQQQKTRNRRSSMGDSTLTQTPPGSEFVWLSSYSRITVS